MSLNTKMVRDSFELTRPILNKVVDRFFENLFTDFPSTKNFFKPEITESQKQAFSTGLVFVVENLDHSDKLVPFLKELGARHQSHNVEEKNYEWMGQTFMKTLEQFFGGAWTPEMQSQWAIVFNTIANLMIDGAKESAPLAKVIPFPEPSVSPENLVNPVSPVISSSSSVTSTPSLNTSSSTTVNATTSSSESIRPVSLDSYSTSPVASLSSNGSSFSVQLPTEVKNRIREDVRLAIQKAIQSEVQSAIENELQNLNPTTVTSLFKKAA